MSGNLYLATCVGRVKHQRKGPDNTAKKTTRVDMRMRVLLGITILMKGGRMTVHNTCMKMELDGTKHYLFIKSSFTHIGRCVARVKHQRKGPNDTTNKSTRVDTRWQY